MRRVATATAISLLGGNDVVNGRARPGAGLSVILSMTLGLATTLAVAALIYALAFASLPRRV